MTRHAAAALLALALVLAALPATARAQSCPTTAPAEAVTPAQLRDMSARYVRDGLYRVGGTRAHEQSVAWLKQQLQSTKDVSVREFRSPVPAWEPRPRAKDGGADLSKAAKLAVRRPSGALEELPVAGAVPFSLPTDADGIGGKLTHIEAEEEITAANAKGRVLVMEVPYGSVPYAAFGALAWYSTPDNTPTTAGTYERPY